MCLFYFEYLCLYLMTTLTTMTAMTTITTMKINVTVGLHNLKFSCTINKIKGCLMVYFSSLFGYICNWELALRSRTEVFPRPWLGIMVLAGG